MPTNNNEDLFEDTKMTFGEHLEALRGSLLKAVLALIVGATVGLFFGKGVVIWMQGPLKTALENYYKEQAANRYKELVAERAADERPPIAGEMTESELAVFMETEQLYFEEVLLDPRMVLSELRGRYPQEMEGVTLPALEHQLTKDDFVPVLLWRSVKDDPRTKIKTLNAQESFMIYMKAALIFGAVCASPFIFYFVWEFVAAGLYPHEKRYVNLFLPISVGLFLAGASLAFYVVFQFVLDFLFGFNEWLGLDPDPRISEWISFAMMMPIGFGLSFQLPLVMLFLERIGVFSVSTYLSKWRIAVLVISIISMVLTPADPMSMILMGAPLIVLYFLGIAFCHYMPRSRSQFDETID